MPSALMDLVEIVREGWGFTGLVPARILDVNAFGNLLVEDAGARIWRICPEELSCEVVATSLEEVERISASDDWRMDHLVAVATVALGSPGVDRCFCLKIPGVLGGAYQLANVGAISIAELIAFAGDLASRIKDLPDGTQIELKTVVKS
jgi:hypothetical protein